MPLFVGSREPARERGRRVRLAPAELAPGALRMLHGHFLRDDACGPVAQAVELSALDGEDADRNQPGPLPAVELLWTSSREEDMRRRRLAGTLIVAFTLAAWLSGWRHRPHPGVKAPGSRIRRSARVPVTVDGRACASSRETVNRTFSKCERPGGYGVSVNSRPVTQFLGARQAAGIAEMGRTSLVGWASGVSFICVVAAVTLAIRATSCLSRPSSQAPGSRSR